MVLLTLDNSRSDHLHSALFGALSQLLRFPYVAERAVAERGMELAATALGICRHAPFASRLHLNTYMFVAHLVPWLSTEQLSCVWYDMPAKRVTTDIIAKCRTVSALRANDCVWCSSSEYGDGDDNDDDDGGCGHGADGCMPLRCRRYEKRCLR